MRTPNPSSFVKFYGWLLLILLAAVFLRLYNLSIIPPGLTHDEADHGITAWGIANEGVRDIYFTIGYGREPLYDYVTAALMTVLGSTYLAGRIIAVYSSILLIAAMFAWVRRAFDHPTALLTVAGLAVSFWPVMAGRQALRSTLLPTLFALAVTLFWLGLVKVEKRRQNLNIAGLNPLLLFTAAGIFLGLTIYTYIPARGLWFIFPALLLYFFFVNKTLLRRLLLPTGLMLLIMFFIAAPLLLYLAAHPTSELRIQQLATPLFSAASGDWSLITGNIQQSLRLFFLEGDAAWRYNISGKPLLGPLMGLFFLAGFIIAIWYAFFRKAKGQGKSDRHYGPAAFLALAWLIAGVLPVLITGSNLAMTQAIGMQPVLYLFPALALSAAGQMKIGAKLLFMRRWVSIGLALFFLGSAVITYRDYFIIWANDPEVRVQYESTLSTALAFLNKAGNGPVAISTITPNRYHSPAVAQMLLRNEAVSLRWFDARNSLLLPDLGDGLILIPGFTPLPPALERFFSLAELQETMPLRESDLDRPLAIYRVDGKEMLADWEAQLTSSTVQFGGKITLLGYDLRPSTIAPGGKTELVTLWQTDSPLEDAVLFAHVLGDDGIPFAQKDQLGVPGFTWQQGSLFLQLHELEIPPESVPGQYPVVVGVYTQPDGKRLSLSGPNEEGDLFHITDLTITR